MMLLWLINLINNEVTLFNPRPLDRPMSNLIREFNQEREKEFCNTFVTFVLCQKKKKKVRNAYADESRHSEKRRKEKKQTPIMRKLHKMRSSRDLKDIIISRHECYSRHASLGSAGGQYTETEEDFEARHAYREEDEDDNNPC